MSASLRFLAMAVVVWAGVRAATLGAIPGADLRAPLSIAATASADVRPGPTQSSQPLSGSRLADTGHLNFAITRNYDPEAQVMGMAMEGVELQWHAGSKLTRGDDAVRTHAG